MTDFSKVLEQAKELEAKMKESQEKIKNITAEGTSGSNSVNVVLNGDGEIIKIDIGVIFLTITENYFRPS